MIWLKLPKSCREHKRKPTYVLRSCRKPRWKSAISRLSPLRWNKVVQHVALVLRWFTGSDNAGWKSGKNGCNWTCHVSLNPPSDLTSAVKEKTEKTAAKKRPAAKWLFYRGQCSLYHRLPSADFAGTLSVAASNRGYGWVFVHVHSSMGQWRLWILSQFWWLWDSKEKVAMLQGWMRGATFLHGNVQKQTPPTRWATTTSNCWGFNMSYTPINVRKIPWVTWIF